MKEKYAAELTGKTAGSIIRKEIGYKFVRVLEDAGVFKQTEYGLAAFRRFADLLAGLD
ncbi:galactose-1-phosphate uridylyltransferase [Mycobacteroides abscessus subsp. abscessus]|nr:galactose-1-phosphate uridylyltransferase [Mycobacteroides abscessus subsp. abscessus]